MEGENKFKPRDGFESDEEREAAIDELLKRMKEEKEKEKEKSHGERVYEKQEAKHLRKENKKSR